MVKNSGGCLVSVISQVVDTSHTVSEYYKTCVARAPIRAKSCKERGDKADYKYIHET